ncbi:unnamed protein product [Sphagnum balticum]
MLSTNSQQAKRSSGAQSLANLDLWLAHLPLNGWHQHVFDELLADLLQRHLQLFDADDVLYQHKGVDSYLQIVLVTDAVLDYLEHDRHKPCDLRSA